MSLFHFTDASAVHSILTNQTIWLTDFRFLNDSRELFDGIDIFSEALKHPIHGFFSSVQYKKDSIEYLKKSFSDSCSFGINEEPIFIFSLSRVGALLSQWRSYGSYAIEFDEKAFKTEFPDLKACIYKTEEKIKTATALSTNSLAKISQDMKANEGRIGISSLDSLVDIMGHAAVFKDAGFAEEQEMRIVEKASVMEGDDNIKFRQKNNILIPYIEKNISLDCIRAIHVGPMQDQELAFISMAAFVRNIEKNWQIESSNIEYELRISKSQIPYRETL